MSVLIPPDLTTLLLLRQEHPGMFHLSSETLSQMQKTPHDLNGNPQVQQVLFTPLRKRSAVITQLRSILLFKMFIRDIQISLSEGYG